MKFCPSAQTHTQTHTQSQHACACTDIRRGCASLFCAVCHSINCSFRALPGLWLVSQCEQSLSAQTPTLAYQHGSVWHSRPWQRCWALKVSMPLHKSADKNSCKSGFSSRRRWATVGDCASSAVLPPSPSVAFHLTFVLPKIFKLLLCLSLQLHCTLLCLYFSEPKSIRAHISSPCDIN